MSPSRIVAAALAVALAVAAHAGEPSRLTPAAGPVKVGEPFPSFAGFDLRGTLVTSRALFRTRPGAPAEPVVVSFFATWCKPCERHLPELARVAKESGARLVLVDVGDEDPGAVREFLDGLGAKEGVVLADKALAISQRAGVTKALPRTFVLDGAGRVAAVFEHEGDDFEAVLAAELAKIPRAIASAPALPLPPPPAVVPAAAH